MLRFDVPPVWSHVTRWEAFVNFAICGLALWLSPWLMLILVAQGLVRGFWGHYRCPSHHVWVQIFTRLGWAGQPKNAGSKMFANRILAVASSLSVIVWALGSPLWIWPCVALMVFTTQEWLFSYCAACSVYAWWHSKRAEK